MPIKENAKKALRQTIKRTRRNALAKAELKSLRVKLRKLLGDNKTSEAVELARLICKKLDKLHARGIMKKNTVARTKSRVMKSVNALLKKK